MLNVLYLKERVRLTKYQANEQRVKADIAEKHVIAVEDIQKNMSNLFTLMRTRLLNVPDKMELHIIGDTDREVFCKELSQAIKDAMYEVCDGYIDTIENMTKDSGRDDEL